MRGEFTTASIISSPHSCSAACMLQKNGSGPYEHEEQI